MKFSDMPYVRPDVPALRERLEELTARLEAAGDFDTADALFQAMDKETGALITADSLAYIRHTIDTNDPYYDEEVKHLAQALPLLREAQQNWTRALLNHPLRPRFEEKYGALLFRNMELELKTFSPEIVPQLQQESALTIDYDNLIASAQIPFEGGVYTLSQLAPFKQDPDDGRRRGAWEAEGRFYTQHGEELDRLYDQLVAVRTEMARKLGYANYVQLGYDRLGRNCYGPEEVAAFRRAVVEHLVPVACDVVRGQARRLGKDYPLNFADLALFYRSGNACPQGSPEEILEQGRIFYHQLSPETAEFIDFMLEGELMDVLSRKGKSGGGYCTSLPDYHCPFIFANFNGTQHDVEVITHEAGHAFADYRARDISPLDSRSPTMEACEVHSMSMEFFAWPWAELFFGAGAEKYRYKHLSDALTFIPYGAMVDHFQEEVYKAPHLTPDQRHQLWRELMGVYMPWVKLDSLPFYGEGKGWQRQSHIYQNPFYYIDYCLAQTVALEFWAADQEDHGAAWERYLAFVSLAGREDFRALVKAAGMASPFGGEALNTVAAAAQSWLAEHTPE